MDTLCMMTPGQFSGATGTFPGLSGFGVPSTGAVDRVAGVSPSSTISGLASQAQATQAMTLSLLMLLIQLLQPHQSGAQAGSTQGAGLAGTAPSGGTAAQGGAAATAGAGASASQTPGQLKADSKGRVSPKDLRAYLEKRIASSKLNGFKPRDGSRYGVDGSPGSWAALLTKLVGKESDYSTKSVGDVGVFNGGSRGLFQLSYDDAKSYGLNGGKAFTAEQLADPQVNADAAVDIFEHLVLKSGSISGGAGKYWGPIKRGWTGN